MITVDQYNTTLSSNFNNAIVAKAQKIKPKVIVTWLDSRHLDNLVVTTNDPHANNSYPNIGFYFSQSEVANGNERQSFTWAVTGAKDYNGDIIKADGTWYTMPSLTTSDLANSRIGGNLEFGWWSGSKSNSVISNTYSGYGFVTDPYVDMAFTTRKVNKIRVITSEYYGQVANYELFIYDASNNLINNQSGSIPANSYYKDHLITTALSTQNIARIRCYIRSTKNPVDHARIQEIVPIYEEDMTNYIISVSVNRTREVHQTSLPIGGNEISSANIDFDNTTKKFNVFDANSEFGKYMKKDLKVEIYSGWRIKKPQDDYINNAELITFLTANANSSTTTLYVNDASIFPTGGAGNHFIVVLDKNNQSQEYILCSGVTQPNILNVVARGYAGSSAISHSSESSVVFDIYEYVINGTFYIDEWDAKSSDMSVGASMQDWRKYLTENTIKYGFLEQNTYVGDAVEALLLRSNFPKADIKKLNTFSRGAILRGAIVGYSFNEESVDRSGNDIISSSGLRARFWGMPSNKKNTVAVKDILADALDKQLTKLDLALGQAAFVSPSYVNLSKSISTDPLNALQLSNYSFVGQDDKTYIDYYNGVFDGYYIPKISGNQRLVIYIQSGGVKLYIDDILILDAYEMHESNVRVQSEIINLTAGVPRKLRIEFYHSYNNTNNSSTFSISLHKFIVSTATESIVKAAECVTIVALDSIGVRNGSSINTNPDCYLMRNNGIYINNPKLSQRSGLNLDSNISSDKSVLLESNAYIRIPNHESFNFTNSNASLYTGEWSVEFFGKFSNAAFSGDGEYISTWSNAASVNGFELYSNTASHGFKIKTLANASLITETVSSNVALPSNAFNHIVATYDGTSMFYYVNGNLKANIVLTGTPIAFTGDITIGGRGSSYTENTGELQPATIRSFTIDEFFIYNEHLSSEDIVDRYSESQIKPLTKFAFLYGNDKSIKDIMDDVTFAELGRVYIDEFNNAKYEHYYRFFEPSIDQHSNVQMIIDDSNHIIDAAYSVQLQCNKVTVPLSNLQKSTNRLQSLWTADEDTTVTAVLLTANLTANANFAQFSEFVDGLNTNIPFPEAGYIKIDNEIIKYNEKAAGMFMELERGQFQTIPAAHNIYDANGSLNYLKIREVKYFDLQYQKSPAFNVRAPFVTAIGIDEPDLLEIHRYIPYSYGAELIIAASNNVPHGRIVFLSGVDRKTLYPYATSISGIAVELEEQKSDIKSQTASIPDSIKKYGLKDITIQSNFIDNAIHAQKIANFIIEKTQVPVPILNINTVLMPKVQLGDRIRISNLTALGVVNTDYWVISYNRSIGNNFSQQMILRQVS
jgi:hypothetical protein